MGSMGRVFHLFSSSKVLRLLLKKYTSIFLSSRCPSDKYHRYIYPLYLSLLPESILLESRKEAKFHTRLPFSLQPPTSNLLEECSLFSSPILFNLLGKRASPAFYRATKHTNVQKVSKTKKQRPKFASCCSSCSISARSSTVVIVSCHHRHHPKCTHIQ